jgi:hypothetical protein
MASRGGRDNQKEQLGADGPSTHRVDSHAEGVFSRPTPSTQSDVKVGAVNAAVHGDTMPRLY